MSVRNNVVIALAIVILAGQGCEIGPLDLGSVVNPDDGCCDIGGFPPPTIGQMYFDRSADTIVTGDSDTLRLYVFTDSGSAYFPPGLQLTVGDARVATVQISDSTPPPLLTIHGLAPGATTLTARADGQSSITLMVIVTDSL